MAVACRTRGEANQRGSNAKPDTRGTGGGVGDGGGLAEGVEGRFESRFLDLDMKNELDHGVCSSSGTAACSLFAAHVMLEVAVPEDGHAPRGRGRERGGGRLAIMPS